MSTHESRPATVKKTITKTKSKKSCESYFIDEDDPDLFKAPGVPWFTGTATRRCRHDEKATMMTMAAQTGAIVGSTDQCTRLKSYNEIKSPKLALVSSSSSYIQPSLRASSRE